MSNFKFKCPLCGYEFDKSDEKCHACPMGGSCNVTCCPNCGYSFTADSKLVDWLKRKFGSKKPDEENSGKEDRS